MAPAGGSWPACVASVAAALLLATVVVRLFSTTRPSGIIKQRAATATGTAGARLPAGSLGWPVLGETPAFIFAAYSRRPESFVETRRLLYGTVFTSHLWGSPAVVSSDPSVSRAVLQSDASAFVPWYPRSLMELMGESSILVLGGGLQRRVHGLAGAFFKSPQLKARVTADMQRRVGAAMDAWWCDGGAAAVVRVQDQAKSIVFEILVRVLIGLEAGQEMQYLKQQFQEFIAGLISLPIKFPGTQLYRSLKAKKRMTKLIQKIIQEKRKKRTIKGENGYGTPRDAIDVLLSNGSDELTDELISDNMIDFMIPAEDSVPVLITLAVKYLSECPRALQQLEEENMELKRRKSDSGETLEWTDYMSLTFTQHVITETLRLGNIINGIMRRAVRDVDVRGHLIPKGWRVLIYFRAVHLDAGVHDDPHAFNPWRWKERAIVTMSSTGGFTPFGGGQRLCPGLDLAKAGTWARLFWAGPKHEVFGPAQHGTARRTIGPYRHGPKIRAVPCSGSRHDGPNGTARKLGRAWAGTARMVYIRKKLKNTLNILIKPTKKSGRARTGTARRWPARAVDLAGGNSDRHGTARRAERADRARHDTARVPALDLARLEASIFLHHLVTNFRWAAEEDTVVNFPTVRLKRGMPIAVTPRT